MLTVLVHSNLALALQWAPQYFGFSVLARHGVGIALDRLVELKKFAVSGVQNGVKAHLELFLRLYLHRNRIVCV